MERRPLHEIDNNGRRKLAQRKKSRVSIGLSRFATHRFDLSFEANLPQEISAFERGIFRIRLPIKWAGARAAFADRLQ
jgi:hypothetical protein